jgi:phosphate:Na+ symporter
MRFPQRRIFSLIILLLAILPLAAQTSSTLNLTYGEPFSIWSIFTFLGAIGLFIFGMKTMSEGLQKLAGDQLRGLLKNMAPNRLSGIFRGALVTGFIQSSSATTVMVVSFVNSGLLTLSESMAVIMGANIGTTVTTWIIAYLGFISLSVDLSLVLIGLAVPLLFLASDRFKQLAEFILGFGLLLIGMDYLLATIPHILSDPNITVFINPYLNKGFWSVLLFILIGSLFTIIIQSSSATMAVTLVLLSLGLIDFTLAAALVLGGNIGTTITANIAALKGNVHARRAAWFHTLFNVIGVLLLLPFYKQFVPFIESLAYYIGFTKELALALFHSSFQILNVLILAWFLPLLERLVVKIRPSKGQEDEQFRLRYISAGLMSTPELSLTEAKKELQIFGKIVDKMGFSFSALLFERHKDPQAIIDKIRKREEITDDLEVELGNYLTKVSKSDLSHQASEKIREFLSMANDLERVADIYYIMTKNYQRMVKQEIKLPEESMQELKEMLELVYNSIKVMRKNMELDHEEIVLKEIYQMESETKAMRKKLVKNHYDRLERNVYTSTAGVIYLDYVMRAERIVAHIVNVNESMVGLK